MNKFRFMQVGDKFINIDSVVSLKCDDEKCVMYRTSNATLGGTQYFKNGDSREYQDLNQYYQLMKRHHNQAVFSVKYTNTTTPTTTTTTTTTTANE